MITPGDRTRDRAGGEAAGVQLVTSHSREEEQLARMARLVHMAAIVW